MCDARETQNPQNWLEVLFQFKELSLTRSPWKRDLRLLLDRHLLPQNMDTALQCNVTSDDRRTSTSWPSREQIGQKFASRRRLQRI